MTIQYLEKRIEELEKQVKTLSQEPSEDVVSRQAVLDYLKANVDDFPDYHEAIEAVLQLPSVRPQEQTGHWIRHDTGHSIYYDCSRCGCIAPCTETADAWLWKLSKYCPDCGAYMVEQRESEVKE